jgi:cytochrome c oxidase subunit 1
MFGRMMNETLAKWHFWTTMIPINGIFTGMMLVGYGGMHRRLYNPFIYDFMQKLIPINNFITVCAVIAGFAQFIFLYNFFKTIFGKNVPAASANPWEVGTLEWEIPSPAPHYNFLEIPHVKCGPHEFGNPNLTSGRDYQYQTEELVKA